MKKITDTEVYGELASARDLIGEMGTRLFMFSQRVSQEDTPEGRLLASSLREIQLAMAHLEDRLNVTALCYAD